MIKKTFTYYFNMLIKEHYLIIYIKKNKISFKMIKVNK